MNGHKKKKQRDEVPPMIAMRHFGDQSPMMHAFSPLGYPNQQGAKKEKMMYPVFQHHPSFGPGTQLMSGNSLFAFPSAHDLGGLGRAPSFTFVSELLATGSSGNLIAPQSPVLGATSPLMPQPGMHRIPSIGGSFGGPLGSFSINSPSTQLAINYAFPSQANMSAGEQPN